MRLRELSCGIRHRLRLALEATATGEPPLVRLGLPAEVGGPSVLLDLYGAELLSGFLLSARVAGAGLVAPEEGLGDYPFSLRLTRAGEEGVIEIVQGAEKLAVVQPLWDRLYAELLLVLAHGRHLAAPARFQLLEGRPRPRLLH
ncbi:hypothetical protein GCM10022281_10890 [Sphingomonas rosea]|uniref:Uncharacterized protein n=1 Tax=Sphingomonas rosea TaxID=335605 RepID=A0ABP7TYL1_9SPHN